MIKGVNILVIEDDVDINNLICRILIKEGYNVRGAYSGSEGKMCIEQYDYNLIVLDLMLPGIVGEELIKDIRLKRTIPIIVISAKNSLNNKVEVLKLGADDFISKPFDIEEVIARVEAQLRRYMIFSEKVSEDSRLIYKGIVLDREERRVFVNGEECILTVREFDILELLISHPKKVFTRANLFQQVWNDEFLGDDNTINVHISNLRSKIAKIDSDTEYIHTVWGIGFKLQE